MSTIPMKTLIAALLFFVVCVTAGRASAACLVSQPSVTSMGSLSSLSLGAAGNTTQIPSGFICTGALLTVVYTQSVNAQIQSITALRNAAGDVLPVQLCNSANCATPYTAGQSILWRATSLIGLLGFFNGADGSLPLYVRIPAGSYNVSPGVYRGSITIGWTWNICWGLGLLGVCIGQDIQNTPVPVTLALTFTVTADCRLSAPNVVFAPSPLVTAFRDVHQSLAVGCSKGQSYTVGLSGGNQGDSVSRVMSSSSGGRLRYEIYKKATTERWGNTGIQRRTSATADTNATALDGVSQQIFSYTAHILTTQDTPALGAYSDTIVIDIQF
ncbi:spore coat U domain-containing protein [Asaia spathodeae]